MTVRVISVLLVLFASHSLAQVVPLPGRQTSPQALVPGVAKVVELTLEDPRNAESKSYLDLDTGTVFPNGDSHADDYSRFNKWIVDGGIDLKSDTIFPSDGFATYELAMLPAEGGFDTDITYDALMAQFKTITAPSFRLERVGLTLPRTVLFKTAGGAVGVMEIIEKTSVPSGLKLRFKLIPEPELILGRGGRGRGRGGIAVAPGAALGAAAAPVPFVAGGRRGGAPVNPANPMNPADPAQLNALRQQIPGRGGNPAALGAQALAGRAGRGGRGPAPAPGGRGGGAEQVLRQITEQEDQLLATHQQTYQSLRQVYGDNHPAVQQIKAQLDARQRLLAAAAPVAANDAALTSLSRRMLELQRSRSAIDDQMRQLQLQIQALERDSRAQGRAGPTTAPNAR